MHGDLVKCGHSFFSRDHMKNIVGDRKSAVLLSVAHRRGKLNAGHKNA